MPDERASPSGGWRAVYREMGADPDAERDDPVDGDLPTAADEAADTAGDGEAAADDADGEERPPEVADD